MMRLRLVLSLLGLHVAAANLARSYDYGENVVTFGGRYQHRAARPTSTLPFFATSSRVDARGAGGPVALQHAPTDSPSPRRGRGVAASA